MLRSWMLGGVFAAVLASASASWGGIVLTRDGRTIEGEVSEQGDQVIIDRHGMRVVLDRTEVKSISNSGSVLEEYTRRHEKLSPGDIRGRIELARWLLEKKEYDLAREVLAEARRFSMRNADVIAMQQSVDRQQELDELQARKKGPVQLAALDNSAVPPTTKPFTLPPPGPVRPLTADEINLVRQNEWAEGQVVRVTFKNDVRRAFVTYMVGKRTPAEFNRAVPAAQAWDILQNGTADMKPNVVILQDPPTLVQYKMIQRSYINGCANCHTYGKTSSRFALKWPANSDGDTYANFIILTKYSTRVGERDYLLIDRDHPSDSLLLQFALPPNAVPVGGVAHPDLDKKYRGTVRTTSDLNYRRVDEWLNRTLNPVTPDYSSLDVGGPGPTTRPAPKK